MAGRPGLGARYAQFSNRLQARLAAREKPAKGFVSQPEPRTIGYITRGRQILAGNLMFAGHVVETDAQTPWGLTLPHPDVEEALHSFGWLDDLAAVGDFEARRRAQAWLWGWIDAYGSGHGPGWTPDVTGRRLIRWVHHALFLLRGASSEQSARYFKGLAVQMKFLSRRAHATAPGLGRFEAWTGLLYAALSIEGMEHYIVPARAALASECSSHIDAQGGIPTRNPQDLLEVFTLLIWARVALEEAGEDPDPEIDAAVRKIAPALRMLRHADGGLPRFHGGGRAIEGRLDAALAASGIRRKPPPRQAMGFARLSAGRTSVIIDAGLPPTGAPSANAHASTLGFELTSGRRPMIVNCGSGRTFGPEWRRAGRASMSHSTLSLQGLSSARLSKPRWNGGPGRELLEGGPTEVPVQLQERADGVRFEGGQDGFVPHNGLTHARSLHLSLDGRVITGEDYLVALDDPAKARFDKALDQSRLEGLAFSLHFHLHPDVDVALDMGDTTVSMALLSGELWLLRFEDVADLTLEPSVYLDSSRIQPRATKQVVLSGRAMQYATRVRWTLAKAQDTALAVRDMGQEDADVYE